MSNLNCEDDELAKVCVAVCQRLACGDGHDVATCKGDCVERMADAEVIDDQCASAYQKMLECLNVLDCVAILTWEGRRGKDLEYECSEETEIYIAQCPGVWFADP